MTFPTWLMGLSAGLGGLQQGFQRQQDQQRQQQMVQTLMQQRGMQSHGGLGATPATTGGQYGGMYEGNIPTAANPYTGGQFGMPSQASATSTPPAPPTGAPPVQPSVFDQGTAAVPFSNGGSVDPITAMMMPPPG